MYPPLFNVMSHFYFYFLVMEDLKCNNYAFLDHFTIFYLDLFKCSFLLFIFLIKTTWEGTLNKKNS